ncbi:MAG TPA: PQQ-binding-like beta-propeller repeat protein [Lacipirellula sp.]
MSTLVTKQFAAAMVLSALALAPHVAVVQAAPALVTREQAARHGLERAWFAQVPVDPSRSRVSQWYLYRDHLYAVTNSGIVAALNAETGELLWARQVGKPGYPAFGPGANSEFLGVVSGSKLYVLDRHDGRLMWSRSLGSAPSSGPALSDTHAFVALVTGRIEGYNLADPAAQPWYYQSKGRTFLKPTATGRVVSWPTTAGYLYVSRADEPGVLFRLETSADIVTSPAYMDPYLYIASQDGYLYCVHQLTGVEQWRYSTGYSIDSSPAIVGGQAYVASVQPAIHALDARTGQLQWTVPGVSHFAAQGKERVYASDDFGNLIILDAKTGTPVSRMQIADGHSTLVNDQTDRIFLVSDSGLVQCLREIGATQPTFYRTPPAPGAAPPTAPVGATPPAPETEAAPEDASRDEPPAPAPENPFAFGADAMEDQTPAEAADEPPADEPPAGDVNPFEDFSQ